MSTTEMGPGSSQPTPVSIADPGPLGLAGFAMTTFILSLVNSQVLTVTGVNDVLPLALAYGGLAQLLAGMWEFRKGNTFGALAFSSYGAFWIAVYVELTKFPSGFTYSTGWGYFLLAWTIFTFYMLIASMKTSGAVFMVFLTLTVTFALLCAGTFSGKANVVKAGGDVGIATAIFAWYASFAAVTNSTFKRTVLPVFPLN
ncbi:MAG: acetate uptake transporter [Acidimicrobiales bacterium]